MQRLLWVAHFPEHDKSTAKAPAPKGRTSKRQKHMTELMVVHSLSAERFKDDSRDHANAVIKELAQDDLLSPLDDAARKAAALFIFPAHMQDRLKGSGKYWILDGIGPEFPFPLGIGTDYIPRWKRPARTLERILHRLDELHCEVRRIQDHLVSSHGRAMPEYLMIDAIVKLWQAVEWMRAFPAPTELLSKHRESLRSDAESESAECVSYVLDHLFRKRAKRHLKVKECECRIAEIERKFLGQNVVFHADFGCPAVRAHVRKVKGWERRKAIDEELKNDLEFADLCEMRYREVQVLGAVEYNKRLDVTMTLLDELSKHLEAYSAWSERTEAVLKARLSAQLVEGITWDEARKVTGEYFSAIKGHLASRSRYLSEREKYTEATRHLDGEFWERVQSARRWMADLDRTWSLAPSTGLVRSDRESNHHVCIPPKN